MLNLVLVVGLHAGLGDIAVPGLLACLALRFDSSKLTLPGSKAAAADAEEVTVNRASEEILQQRPYFVTTMVICLGAYTLNSRP